MEGLSTEVAGLWRSIPKVTSPVLVVRGADSPLLLAGDAAELAAAFGDGQVVEIPGAGHTVQGDNPRALVEELRRFFDSLTL